MYDKKIDEYSLVLEFTSSTRNPIDPLYFEFDPTRQTILLPLDLDAPIRARRVASSSGVRIEIASVVAQGPSASAQV